mmetsp:Transcript_2053/g.3093  ORF Transcript_2053/g.3093 Transcript_2053/m.3093 type:complete len:270 (-) Transcript_2053:82-891(-)
MNFVSGTAKIGANGQGVFAAGVTDARGKEDGSEAGSATFTSDTLTVQMKIALPKKEVKKEVKVHAVGSLLSSIIVEQRQPEPVYLQSVDCVAIPDFFTPKECGQIVEFATSMGFTSQSTYRGMRLSWVDLIDPLFARCIWELCGLEWFLRSIRIDGMEAVGLNDVVRIHRYEHGDYFGKHIDQVTKRQDGFESRYSLRVFLNGTDRRDFEGGTSVFHHPRWADPVLFEPQMATALLYPQGEACTIQEELPVHRGVKYVLRADVMFRARR